MTRYAIRFALALLLFASPVAAQARDLALFAGPTVTMTQRPGEDAVVRPSLAVGYVASYANRFTIQMEAGVIGHRYARFGIAWVYRPNHRSASLSLYRNGESE